LFCSARESCCKIAPWAAFFRCHHEFAQKPWERNVLILTKSALPGARRADVTGFGVPEHHGDGSALPILVRSGNLSLEIWSSGILMEPVAP
jgi:hypothetical protein